MTPPPQPLRMPNVASAIVRSLLCQFVALAGLMMILNLLAPKDPAQDLPTLYPLLAGLAGAGISAFACAGMLGMTLPWKISNALLPPALAASLIINVPAELFVILISLPLALYLPALFAQVPYFPSSKPVIEKLLEILPTDRPFTFIDLGCGFGEPLLSLARARPLGKFYGIDLSPLSIAVAWFRSLFQQNATFGLKNLWTHPLSSFDFVYAFLAPPPMKRLGEKIAGELGSDNTFISNSFPIPDRKSRSVATGDPLQHTLFIYNCGKRVK